MNSPDRSLLPIFSGEQAEHISHIRALLDRLTAGEPDVRAAAMEELLRRLHTLKGAARAVGLESTEALTHQAEEVISGVRHGALVYDAPVRRVLERAADTIEDILAAAIADRPSPDISETHQQLAAFSKAPEAPVTVPVAGPAPADAPRPPTAPLEWVRVDAGNLDDLIRQSSELLVAAGELGEERSSAHAAHVDEVVREWARLRRTSAAAVRELSRRPEFHPVMQSLTYIDNRLAVLSRESRAVVDGLGNAARPVRAQAARAYQSACRIRMTPAEGVLGGFGPMVRELAQNNGRQVSFHIEGLDVSVDRVVLQGLKDPVMHLLRNAVSHGVESPEERLLAGKKPEANIWLRLTSGGDRLTLSVEDDGRGLNYRAVERQARELGLLQADEVLDPQEVPRLVFHPGFSTSKSVTGLSGRGMGLSVVQRSVSRLRGEIGIHSRPDGGTSVKISVPISISTQHILLVAAAGHTFGVPASYVESLGRIRPAEIRIVNGRETILTSSGPLPLVRLAPLLGLVDTASSPEEAGAPITFLILSTNGRRAAIAPERLVDEREAIIKDTGLPESAIGLTAGAVPLEDGSVAVVLSAEALMDRVGRARRMPDPPRAAKAKARKLRILVVDDSLTTRSLEKSILEANGYEVQLAVDGLDALERLRIETPDIVISDVNMPRLSGFQLLEKMKSEEALKKIPVILVTSLESREEQHTGLSLGADAYIVKKKFDQRELLKVIRELI